MSAVLIYTTVSQSADAEALAEDLLNRGLVACVNFFPITAVYRDNNQFNRGAEVAVLFKTLRDKEPEARAELERLHPYSTPLVLTVKADNLNEAYFRWMQHQMQLKS